MIVAISPGHGGDDNGAFYNYIEEDDINLAIAQLLYYELKLSGIGSILLRERDETVSLEQKVKMANQANADLFFSIHCDAYKEPEPKGNTIFIYKIPSVGSLQMGSFLDKQLKTSFPEIYSRGVRRRDLYVLRETKMPAVLVECGFLSNFQDHKFLKEPENHRKLAIAFRKSCVKYRERYGEEERIS